MFFQSTDKSTYAFNRSIFILDFIFHNFFTRSYFFVCLLVKHNALELPFCPSSSPLSRNIGNPKQKVFADQQTAKKIHLFVAIKGNFSGLFTFSKSCSDENSLEKLPRKVSTCLHITKIVLLNKNVLGWFLLIMVKIMLRADLQIFLVEMTLQYVFG